jgi:hypothetical protein
MRGPETIVTPIFQLFPEDYISTSWDYNFGIKIGQPLPLGAKQNWAWEWARTTTGRGTAALPNARTSNPLHLVPPLQPVTPPSVHACVFACFSLHPFLGNWWRVAVHPHV